MAREGLIALADDSRGFAAAIDSLLVEAAPEIRDRRRAFARSNTWEARHDELVGGHPTPHGRGAP